MSGVSIAANWLRPFWISALPEEWTNRWRAKRKISKFRRAGIVLIHVPRAGGTSMSKALYGSFLGHFTIRDVLARAPADVLALPRLAVVRNPWDRLVSAYHFAKSGGGQEGETNIFRANQYQRAEFADFETFVTQWLVRHDLMQLDGVFRPQSYYVCDENGAMPFDHIGRLENIAATEEWLRERVSSFLGLERTNTTARSRYEDYYTPATRDIVADIYKEDIQRFDYRF